MPVPNPKRAQPLHPAQIELAAAIDAIQCQGQFAVGPQQLIAADQIARFRQVGQLEIVARDGVAQVAHREEIALADLIEQFLDEFLAGHALGQVLGYEPHRVERGGDVRPDLLPKPGFHATLGLVNQQGKLPALGVGKPHHGQPPSRTPQVLEHEDIALIGQLPLDRAPSPGKGPFHQVDRVDLPLVVDADLLQVVQQACLGGPNAARRLMQQGKQRLLPRLGTVGVQFQRGLQPADQAVDVQLDCRTHAGGKLRRGQPFGAGPVNGRPYHVAQ